MSCHEARPGDYRRLVYSRYVSAFKAANGAPHEAPASQPKLVSLLKPWLGGVDRSVQVLDLGCGDGGLLQSMRTLGFQCLTGVDFSAEQVERARLASLDVIQGDLADYLRAQPEGRYGILLLFDVIEHLTKPEIVELMQLIATRLKPGGVFIAHCPNGDSPMVGHIHAGDFTHETLLNPHSARHLCTMFGLEAFEAQEHLGASSSWKGAARRFAWGVLRAGLRLWNLVETGSAGYGVFTRQFAFKASRPL